MQTEYLKRCEVAKETKPGDVWKHLKSGKTLRVTGRRGMWQVDVEHESGRKTSKQAHYLAGDYECVESA